MPVNGYNVGKDIRLDVVIGGTPQAFRMATRFQAKQLTTDVKVKRLDGVVDNLYLPDGWDLEFEFERQNNALDAAIAQLEDDYYAGLDGSPIIVTETIRELGGGVSQYRYYGVQLKLDDAGDYKGDATVKQTLKGVASRRRRI